MPAVWSTVIALPFLLVGIDQYLKLLSLSVPNVVADATLAVGGLIMLIGTYVHFVAAPEFRPTSGEHVEDQDNPKTPFVKVKSIIGLALLSLSGYWFFYTEIPYVYPTAALVVGAFLFTTGIWRYWINTLTTYYLTNQRIAIESRFLGKETSSILFEKVKKTTVSRPFYLQVFGLGDITLDSGARNIGTIYHISRTEQFARRIDSHLRSEK
jgi:hypothetical protein